MDKSVLKVGMLVVVHIKPQGLTSESLHLNLVEHLNSEIGLGMVPDLSAAKKWLAGTFLRVRLEDNPAHYRIQGDTPERDLNARLERICTNAIAQLEELALIETHPQYKTTEYGEAMARYCVNITTMKMIIELPRKPKISEIVSGQVCQ